MLEPSYPTVAKMARDILAVPSSAVGVERMFNSGRDTCTYRRGNLLGQTVKEIMIVKHDQRRQEAVRLAKEKEEDDRSFREELKARLSAGVTGAEQQCIDAAFLADSEELLSLEQKLARECSFDVPQRRAEEQAEIETRKRRRRRERRQDTVVRRSARVMMRVEL